jgi:hypothetical protein
MGVVIWEDHALGGDSAGVLLPGVPGEVGPSGITNIWSSMLSSSPSTWVPEMSDENEEVVAEIGSFESTAVKEEDESSGGMASVRSMTSSKIS